MRNIQAQEWETGMTVVVGGVLSKSVLKISQNLQEKNLCQSLFLIKLVKKETVTQMFFFSFA